MGVGEGRQQRARAERGAGRGAEALGELVADEEDPASVLDEKAGDGVRRVAADDGTFVDVHAQPSSLESARSGLRACAA